jgi:hypothetical protein
MNFLPVEFFQLSSVYSTTFNLQYCKNMSFSHTHFTHITASEKHPVANGAVMKSERDI